MIFFGRCANRLVALPLGAALALTLVFAVTGPAHAAATSHRSWCKPTKIFLPPVNFNPLTASVSQLHSNGFPTRPPLSDRKAYSLWKMVVGHAKHFEVPRPVCGTTRHAKLYSGNWAGHDVPRNDYGGNYITSTESEWVQPEVNGDSNYNDYQTAPDASFWTGIGASNIIQAGADSINTSSPTYKMWTEDFPQKTIWEGPAPHPNDTMYVEVAYEGSNEAFYYMENVTTGDVQSFDNAAPYVGNGQADFINERLNGLYLPEFADVDVSDSYFWQNDGSMHLLASTENDISIMTSNCASSGTILSDPTGVDDSDGSFFQEWDARQPYSAC